MDGGEWLLGHRRRALVQVAVPWVTSPMKVNLVLRCSLLDESYLYTGGMRWKTHLGVPRVVAIIRRQCAMACKSSLALTVSGAHSGE
jgi:hypothetical protein